MGKELLFSRHPVLSPHANPRALPCYRHPMRTYTAVIERDADTGLFVGFVPGFPGAHSQGETLDELNENLREVVEMLLEDGEPQLEGEFIGTQVLAVK